MQILPGRPQPLGATFDGDGVNFALFSAHATRVELCLFDAAGDAPATHRIDLPERTGDVWHGRIDGLRPGQLYGYRVHGPYAPREGHRFNPAKLLVDPYARALHGALRWDVALLGHDVERPELPSGQDSAPFVPRGIVTAPSPQRPDSRPPATPWSRTLIYECHVKGMTQRHPDVSDRHRGRFLGLANPSVIEHLRSLGVTAIELLPVAQTAVDEHLAGIGLPNYWGYSPLGFFAPDARFASGSRGEQVDEFRAMVAACHEAGIEVLLDVVYNHTCEGGPLGSTVSLRGIDNASYYRLDPADPAHYLDVTGCGNTLDTTHPHVLQLVLDSLRHWVTEMGVDGFRFDLGVALGRDPQLFESGARFFHVVQQDPVLSRVKLIAEPWDLGTEGYRLGGFPPGFSEWNDRFRDTTRRFWRGDAGTLPDLASRLTGSSDFFGASNRGTAASINYVCSHDGMTLADLVSYSHKHNEANLEAGRDGPNDASCNWGIEGPSRDRRVLRARGRAQRNLAVVLSLSLGVPMWLGGDEIGRTQGGNNNAYCQDNEISWIDWQQAAEQTDWLEFVRRCFAVRRGNAVYRRRRHLDGLPSDCAVWLRPDGKEMTAADWQQVELRCVSLLLDASLAEPVDEDGVAQAARTVFMMLNGDSRTHAFALPRPAPGSGWVEVLNTGCAHHVREVKSHHLKLAAHSMVVLEAEARS